MILMKELAAALAETPEVLCRAALEHDERGAYTLAVTFGVGVTGAHASTAEAMREVESYQVLRHALAVAQMRALCAELKIEPAALEALLPAGGVR